jgi:hypothetical protein
MPSFPFLIKKKKAGLWDLHADCTSV